MSEKVKKQSTLPALHECLMCGRDYSEEHKCTRLPRNPNELHDMMMTIEKLYVATNRDVTVNFTIAGIELHIHKEGKK